MQAQIFKKCIKKNGVKFISTMLELVGNTGSSDKC
jgi:hypothetical protein